MLTEILSPGFVAYLPPPKLFALLAILVHVLGLLTRDALFFRTLILLGTLFDIIYYDTVSDAPLWEAIFGSLAIAAANVFSSVIIIRERSTFGTAMSCKG